jgi:hypothetical protein
LESLTDDLTGKGLRQYLSLELAESAKYEVQALQGRAFAIWREFASTCHLYDETQALGMSTHLLISGMDGWMNVKALASVLLSFFTKKL